MHTKRVSMASARRTVATRIVGACALVGWGGPLANAEGEFRVGAQAGFAQWDMEVGAQIPGQAPTPVAPDAAGGVGVVGQYVVRARPDAERGFFVGFEAAVLAEDVSHAEIVAVRDVPVGAVNEIAWSADLLWLGGYDFGRVSAYLAGGASLVGNELTVSAFGLTSNSAQTHLGWKLAPGVEIDLGGASSLLVRIGYGDYRSGIYADPDAVNLVSLEVAPQVVDVRVAWVYRLNANDLFGIWRNR